MILCIPKFSKRRWNPWESLIFPAMKRVFPALVANQIVSVQPMSLPSGLLFDLDYAYGTQNANL